MGRGLKLDYVKSVGRNFGTYFIHCFAIVSLFIV